MFLSMIGLNPPVMTVSSAERAADSSWGEACGRASGGPAGGGARPLSTPGASVNSLAGALQIRRRRPTSLCRRKHRRPATSTTTGRQKGSEVRSGETLSGLPEHAATDPERKPLPKWSSTPASPMGDPERARRRCGRLAGPRRRHSAETRRARLGARTP